MRVLERLRRPDKRRGRPHVALTPRSWDGALEWPMRMEAGLIRHGARLPVGMSLLMVFRRPVAGPAQAAETPQVAGASVNNL